MGRAAVVEGDDPSERKLLDAALALFSTRGFHGTSIPELLGGARVGASSFYRRFPSKEALVNALFRREKRALQAALEEGLDRQLEPAPLFAAFWARLAGYARAAPASFRFLEMQDHIPYLDGESRARELAVLGPIYVACLDFQQRGVWRTDVAAEVAIALIWGAFVGLFKAERLGYFRLSDAMLDQARDACWRALATSPHSSTEESHARHHASRRRAPAPRPRSPRRPRR
jgi:AcrR family transcriptional regulator